MSLSLSDEGAWLRIAHFGTVPYPLDFYHIGVLLSASIVFLRYFGTKGFRGFPQFESVAGLKPTSICGFSLHVLCSLWSMDDIETCAPLKGFLPMLHK